MLGGHDLTCDRLSWKDKKNDDELGAKHTTNITAGNVMIRRSVDNQIQIVPWITLVTTSNMVLPRYW